MHCMACVRAACVTSDRCVMLLAGLRAAALITMYAAESICQAS